MVHHPEDRGGRELGNDGGETDVRPLLDTPRRPRGWEQARRLLLVLQKVAKPVVAALDLVAEDEGPLGESDGLPLRRLHGECVTALDIARQHEGDGIEELGAAGASADTLPLLGDDAKEPVAALRNVVLEQLHPVEARNGDERVALPDGGVAPAPPGRHGELAAEHLGEEVPVAARRLQEPRIYAFRLLFHHVKHGIYFALSGKNFAMIHHAPARFDLTLSHLFAL